MTERDPRIDPIEGDVLLDKKSEKRLIIDLVRNGMVYFRVVGLDGCLIASKRIKLALWVMCAPEEAILP